jgi:hypothetical protein
MPGKIGTVMPKRDVPNWTRNKKKWENESAAVIALEIGQALPIEFDSEEEALAARNTIRDELNKAFREALENGEPLPMPGMLTTRAPKGSTTAYFTMEDPAAVLGADWRSKFHVDQTPEPQSMSKGRVNQRGKSTKRK